MTIYINGEEVKAIKLAMKIMDEYAHEIANFPEGQHTDIDEKELRIAISNLWSIKNKAGE